MYSLRRTLAVRMCLTMFAALLLIALWAQLGAQRTLILQLDQSLLSAARIAAAAVASGKELPHQSEPADRSAFAQAINRFEVVRDSSAAIVDVNTPLAGDLPADSAALRRARAGESVWASGTWHEDRVRSVYVPAPNGAPGSVIQVAAALEPFAPISSRLLILMLGTVLLGSLATMFGAQWLVGSAMEPVAAIAAQASAIQAGSTGQRITAHADVTEFEGLIRVLNDMLARLDRAFLVQRRLMSDVGHDLKTPITAMLGEMEIALRQERTPAQYQAALRSGLEELDRLAVIADGMTLLARIESGEVTPRPALIDLVELAEERVAHARPRADRRTFAVKLVPGGDGMVIVDAAMLRLVFDHLIDNTIRHTPDGTMVDVTVRTNGTGTELSVSDNGPGVPDPEREHLFERFYRGDVARGRDSGAGLGLSLVAAAVHAHGGTVEAGETPGGGLIVTARLNTPAHS